MVERFLAMEPRPDGVPGEVWAADRREMKSIIMDLLTGKVAPTADVRDYRTEPGLWRSQLLPMGITIDQAVQAGIW